MRDAGHRDTTGATGAGGRPTLQNPRAAPFGDVCGIKRAAAIAGPTRSRRISNAMPTSARSPRRRAAVGAGLPTAN
jgi:hypothetical protein